MGFESEFYRIRPRYKTENIKSEIKLPENIMSKANPAELDTVRPVMKSAKLANVCYDIRGPVMARAKQMEEDGHRIIKLNIGNLASFGFETPEEIQQDVIHNMPNSAGYSDSKGMFAARKAIMHYSQQKKIAGVGMDDIFIGNGASELITMSMQGLLNTGDEVLVPAPDYPLWTAAVTLAGGTPRHYLCDEQNEWMPDLNDMRSKITPNTLHRADQPEQSYRCAVFR